MFAVDEPTAEAIAKLNEIFGRPRYAEIQRQAPSDIDLVFVNGYGFPRLKGGPMLAADRQGLAKVLGDVEEAAAVGGAGSEPAPLLVRLAREGRTLPSDSGRDPDVAWLPIATVV